MKLRKNSKKKEYIIWKITKYDQERRYEYEEKIYWVFQYSCSSFGDWLLCISPKKAKADTVPSLVEEMKNIIDKKIKDDPVLQASSNPNDYIKDNTAYDKLIQMGVKRVPEMLTYLESSDGSGLENYLTALAVEDIMDCNLKETEWEDSKDFVTQFSDMVKDRKKIVNKLRKMS